MRHYRRTRTYTTRERVLIHLSSEGLQPQERTQDGIAAATRSGRSTLTKWLRRLEAHGTVQRERVRLEDHRLPKHAYRLTDSGWLEAQTLRDRLASQVVTVETPGLGPLPVRMAEVPRIASTPLDLAAAVSMVRKGALDLAVAHDVPARPGHLAIWGAGFRNPDRLIGREAELAALDRWYASPSKLLLVTGLPGIGKSALVSWWVQRRTLPGAVFGFQIRRSTTPSALLADLGVFLAELGRRNLATQLTQEERLTPSALERLLTRELAGLHMVFVLDGAEQASRETAALVRGPLLAAADAASAKTILVSRRSLPWIPEPVHGRTAVLRLHGLDRGSTEALLMARGFAGSAGELHRAASSTRGHPLLVGLLAREPARHMPGIGAYLEGELWRTLSPAGRSALEAAAVLRRPVAERVLAAAADVPIAAIRDLEARNLLDRTAAEGVTLHDLIRDFLLDRLADAEKRKLHRNAAQPLLAAVGPRDRWEGVYHLLAAGEVEAVASYLDAGGAPLLDSVAAEEIASLVRGLPPEPLEADASCIFSEILGDSLRIVGHVGPALRQYAHAARIAESCGRPDRVPRLLRKMGFLERCRNRYPKALGYLVEARARLARAPDPPELTEVLREMAMVEEATGELASAASHLNEAVDLATDASDWGALARTLLTLGNLQVYGGRREQGLESCMEGLRAAERSGSITELARAHITVGTALAELQRLEPALTHFDKGLGIATLLGNLRLTAYATMNRTAILIDLGRYHEAAVPLRQAEGFFGILEEWDTLALLDVYEGNRQRGLGRWARAKSCWDAGLAALRERGTPVDLVRALKDVGSAYLEHGDEKEGRAHLSDAAAIARNLGNVTLRKEIDEALARSIPPGALRPPA